MKLLCVCSNEQGENTGWASKTMYTATNTNHTHILRTHILGCGIILKGKGGKRSSRETHGLKKVTKRSN